MNSICRQTVYRLPCAACEDTPPAAVKRPGKRRESRSAENPTEDNANTVRI